MSNKRHRNHSSLIEYPDHIRASKHARIALACVLIIIAAMLTGAVFFALSLAQNEQSKIVGISAQNDDDLFKRQARDTATTEASSEAVNLVVLMGLTKQEALDKIGRGAVVEAQSNIDDHGLKKELTLSLADEKGDDLSGTPSASIKLDSRSKVGAASYSAPLDALGFGEISFTDAVNNYHVIDTVLKAVGITAYQKSALNLPGRKAYSTYESDGKTLKAETYTFSGNSDQEEGSFNWTATLHYDYAEANKTGNLANTVRKISISVRKL